MRLVRFGEPRFASLALKLGPNREIERAAEDYKAPDDAKRHSEPFRHCQLTVSVTRAHKCIFCCVDARLLARRGRCATVARPRPDSPAVSVGVGSRKRPILLQFQWRCLDGACAATAATEVFESAEALERVGRTKPPAKTRERPAPYAAFFTSLMSANFIPGARSAV